MSGGSRHTILAAALAVAVASQLGGAAAAADPATFESRRAAVMKSIETQPEAAVRAVVEEGVAVAQPSQALAAAEAWLRVNLPKDPAFLYHAGRAAERSGEWNRAVVLYQQFLEQGDPKSAQAGDAITGVYALAIQYLDDPAAAYAFGRGMAPKLAVNPRFRQFDRWFLDTAIARADRPAVATRLLATARSGASADEFVALHEGDLRWLVRSMTGKFRYDTEQRFTPEFVADCKALATALPPDDEFRLLLDFVVSVKPYNQAKIAGQEAAPPLAEAKALVEKFPRYAAAVQLEWAGGNNGPYYRDKPEKYWPHELEGKLAPIRAALPKLAPAEQADLLATWSLGHYVSGPQVFTVEQVREFALANPQVVNQKWGPVLAFGWNTLDDAATAKLAAILEQNPSPEASLVRAAVAAGKERDYQKAMDALLGPEVWRLGVDQLNGAYADQLWHWAKQAGGPAKRDEQIARSKAVAAQVQAATIKKEAPAPERLAAFKQLLADFRSPKPQIPAVAARLAQALSVTPEAVPELLRDPGADAQRLLAAALATDFEGPQLPLSGDANVRGLSPSAHDPIVNRFIARHGGNINHLKQHNLYRAHPLEPVLRQAVVERLGKPSIEPWLLIAWVNTQGPKDAVDPAGKPVGDAEQVKLVEALVKSPAWAALPAEARFAVRSAFPRQALPPAQLAVRDAADPAIICKGLLALPKEANAAVTAAALGAAIEGLLKSPVRCDVVGIEKLAEVAPEVFADPQVIGRIVELADSVRSFNVPPPVGQRFFETVNKSRDPATLEKTAAWLWRYVQTTHVIQPVIALADSLVDEKPAAASTLAAAGLGTIARHKHGHTWFNAAVDVPRLQSIRGRAAMKLGLVVIPVPPDHPAYPVYQSQADWLTGNEDTAGQLLDDNWDAFLAAHRQLSVPYLMWALKRSIYARDDARQEALIRPLLAWIAEPVGPFTPAEKVALEIAYGDIAVQRGQLREAYEIFARTRANPAYKDLLARHDAALKQAGVARATKDFESALTTLAELDGERIPELWAPVRHARAEVFFDMEEYDDAADVIDSILARDPDDAEARLLLGKVQVKRQQLMEATEVEFGSAAGQKTLVPGEKLKVTLNDPTLAVSGAGTEIEVAVWTTAGDREQFLLRRFGDQKEKFRGEVATALGAPAAGDGTLQVLGDDEIFYAYSDRFREKIPGLPDTRGGPITVVSDALLQASARKLPSEAEQRLADVREVMAKLGVSETKAGKMLASQQGAAVAETAARAAESAASVAKPGNPIHVRVTDPDRSRTAQIDELAVSVASSNGDSVSRVVLRETGPVTGRFEGSLPTKPAQASAFAANSEPGRNPNMVISPVSSYPAWKPVATKGVVPEFTIDLNDNVPLGELTITAAEPGARLTKFAVQTALNTGEWTTVAVQPKNMLAVADPWGPSVAVLNDTDQWQMNPRPAVPTFAEISAQADSGWMTQQFPLGLAENVAGPSAAFPESILKAIAWKRHNQHDNAHVIHRFRGWFHEPAAVTRKFRLDLGPYQIPAGLHPSVSQPAQHLLAVDGRQITKFGGPLEAEIALEPGVHRFEIWSVGPVTSIGFGRTAKLLANVDAKDPAALVACPDTFFDPKSFPPGAIDHRNAPAELAASPDGNQFRVTFAKGSRARFIRLQLLGHEGPVPALGKIALTSAVGKPVLPVAEDFAALNKNETLEMLPGDTVAVRYVDDRFVTKAKETQERSLNVAFTDARVEFADMEPRLIEGEMRPFYERLLRYRRDEPLTLAIHDADMDVSTESDTVAVTLASKAGGRQEFKAIETGESTGVFKLVITPVAKDAAVDKAAKASEMPNPFIVADGDTIKATYRDQENNRPGVPTDRVTKIDHALFVQPRLLLANASVEAIAPAAPANAAAPVAPDRPRWTLKNTLVPTDTSPKDGFSAVAGQPLYAEFVAPSLVLRHTSTVTVYAQTDTGRRLAAAGGATADGGKKAAAPAFDISVPGTIAVEAALTPARLRVVPRRRSDAGPRDPDELPLVGIYAGGSVWQPFAAPTSDRFCITIPLLPGVLPDHGVLSAEEIQERRRQEPNLLGEDARPTTGGLVVRPGDRVYLGIRFADAGGAEQWLTASTAVVTHPALDLVTKDDAATMTSGYVGETIRMRVVDLGADATDSADAVGVNVQAKSGGKAKVVLHETGPHSGIFEGACVLTYATAPGQTPAPPEDEADDPTAAGAAVQQLPVVYGDTVAARYTDKKGASTETSFLTVSKGADGSIAPFSKTYGDSEIAAQTQFSLAEAYLEMAKRHRGLGQIEAADREYAAAKQMLAGVMNQFNDAETRAHAEFLLGNLTFEEAKTAKDPAAREELLRAALARFMNVTGSYETTPHASKAQFAIATVYEALGEPELAAQDYVKLAYKYPDSEFLAKSMARLGTFFLKRASAYEKQAEPLLAKAETDADAKFQGEKLREQAIGEYVKTARIFGRLQERFPGNELAGPAGLQAGRAYMRAGDRQRALDTFSRVARDQGYDGPKVRAEAMYWAGNCYQQMGQPMAAFSTYKRLTYDFPETEWAKNAIGQLSQPALLELENKLELERLETQQK